MSRAGRPLVFVISSPSGGGKTTLVHRALERLPQLSYSVSYTTRPIRPGELHGRDYHFVERARFEAKRAGGDFAEWALVHGHLYGTDHGVLDAGLAQGRDMILDIDTQGAAQLRTSRTDAVLVFIAPPSWEVLEARLRARETDSSESIRLRLQRARQEVAELSWYDYLIVNDNLEKAAGDLCQVIRAEKLRVKHLAGGAAAFLEETR